MCQIGKMIVVIKGPVWCKESLYVAKGKEACIKVSHESNTSLKEHTPGGLEISIDKDKYDWRVLNSISR